MPLITVFEPDATAVTGTDDSVLRVRFYVDFNGLNNQEEDIFVELSDGDVHVDETSGTPKAVIAFGMTHGWFGSSPSPRIFDGQDWILAESVFTDKRSNHFTLEIMSNTLTLKGEQRASGTISIPRVYRGGFNRISIRTISQNDQTHVLDDITVEGGVVIGDATVAPAVASVAPPEGPSAGGTDVTVGGEHFAAGATAFFGGEPATDVTVLSPTEIGCVTPPHAPGPVPVEVTNPEGLSGVLPDAFRYLASFRRGDANADGQNNIADAVYILQNLFAGGPSIVCPDAADANDDEGVNIADAVYILQNLFAGGPALPAPSPGCGIDPTSTPGQGLPDCAYCEALCNDPPQPENCP
jgi:hypothetical protein